MIGTLFAHAVETGIYGAGMGKGAPAREAGFSPGAKDATWRHVALGDVVALHRVAGGRPAGVAGSGVRRDADASRLQGPIDLAQRILLGEGGVQGVRQHGGVEVVLEVPVLINGTPEV